MEETRLEPRLRLQLRRWWETSLAKVRRFLAFRKVLRTLPGRALQTYLHPLGGGPDFLVVVAGVRHNLVDDHIGVVGVVVIED